MYSLFFTINNNVYYYYQVNVYSFFFLSLSQFFIDLYFDKINVQSEIF